MLMLRDADTQSLFEGYYFENKEDPKDIRVSTFTTYT